MQTAELSMQLPEDLAAQLGELAQAVGQSTQGLALQALRDFVAQERWQLAEIEKGLAEADRGDFASEDEMRALYSKWGIR